MRHLINKYAKLNNTLEPLVTDAVVTAFIEHTSTFLDASERDASEHNARHDNFNADGFYILGNIHDYIHGNLPRAKFFPSAILYLEAKNELLQIKSINHKTLWIETIPNKHGLTQWCCHAGTNLWVHKGVK